MTTKKSPSFEEAYKRLEEILNKMNNDQVALDDSLKLFEEADQLIRHCNEKLQGAEQKVEMLLKTRSGQLQKDDEGLPARTPFTMVNTP